LFISPYDFVKKISLCLRFCPAVREDRMPGGRNSGAVYNLYKVKYKKHKKGGKNGSNKEANGKGGGGGGSMPHSPLHQYQQQHSPYAHHMSPHHLQHQHPASAMMGGPLPLANGNILKTALTNPSEVRVVPPFFFRFQFFLLT
jgi:hypothetical protein